MVGRPAEILSCTCRIERTQIFFVKIFLDLSKCSGKHFLEKARSAGPLAFVWPFLTKPVCYWNHSIITSSGYPG